MTTIEGAPVRVWHGMTERGTACIIYVRLLAVHSSADNEDFERELCETGPPDDLVPFADTLT